MSEPSPDRAPARRRRPVRSVRRIAPRPVPSCRMIQHISSRRKVVRAANGWEGGECDAALSEG